VNLVVGVEVDEPNASYWEVRRWKWGSRFQLCQWTFMARSGHPVLAAMVERVVRTINRMAQEEGTTVEGLRKLTRLEVLAVSGPVGWTLVIEDYLSKASGTQVDWRNMTGLQTPKQIHDVLVLPVTSFGPGQRHSGSRKTNDPQALSFHHFGASQWGVAPGRWTWKSLFGFLF